ncbi:MAG: M1 family metallopeptidase, partial [Acidimicrobiales bacterium]
MSTTTDDPSSYRLATTVVPHRYRLELTPDLEAATFAGTAEIDLTVQEPVDHITLNAAELDITSAEVTEGSDRGRTLATTLVDLDDEEERATLTFSEALTPGPATLRLTFTGILNDKLHGFYRSSFTDDDGIEHVIATTQFEPADAR